VKSRRDEKEVPDGTNYEAMEGARAGSAVRERKCQVVGNSGGAAVRTPTLTSGGRVFISGTIGAASAGNKSGEGSVRRTCSALYCDFSTEQQPLSLQWPWALGRSEAHRRNSRPGTDSSWQCAETGSQRKAASAKMMFLKYRTPVIDARKPVFVQSIFSIRRLSQLHAALWALPRRVH